MLIKFLNGAEKELADLRGANLREANLYGADLRGANLREANLCGTDLRGANLREANLCGADLYKANLCGANLREANLCGANLYEANLCGAKGIIVGPMRSDGYTFYVVGTKEMPIIKAGCRYFLSFLDAEQHWSDTRGGTKLGDETTQILSFLKSMIQYMRD